LLYETCDDVGCHAGYKITGEIASALKKGSVATHKVYDSRQKPVSVPVSLKGLSKALEKLVEVSR
jgi:invasion protein IalB